MKKILKFESFTAKDFEPAQNSCREFKCQDCGSIIDRDLNASLNIEKEGLKNLLGPRLSEFTLGDLPLMESTDLSVDSNVRLN